jgi:hypothetical protein
VATATMPAIFAREREFFFDFDSDTIMIPDTTKNSDVFSSKFN